MAISWIKAIHDEFYNTLYSRIGVKEIIDAISEYSIGFVHVGRLNMLEYKNFRLHENIITYQIKYFGGFTFIDFWKPNEFFVGDNLYLPCWNIGHYTYIYNGQSIFYDKVNFNAIVDNDNMLLWAKPSVPIYDIKKLINEVFTEFICEPQELDLINNNPILYNTQDEIKRLYDIFKYISSAGSIGLTSIEN
jgi:hypothetical protein